MKKVLWTVLGWIGAFLGWQLGRSAPVELFMALGGMWIAALLSRRVRPAAQPMRPSLIAQGGVLFATTAGMLIGLAAGQQLPFTAAFEAILFAAGLVWLAALPGILPVLLLALYQLVAITGNLYTIFFATPPSGVMASTTATGLMAVFLRGAGTILMFTGLHETRRQTITVSPPEVDAAQRTPVTEEARRRFGGETAAAVRAAEPQSDADRLATSERAEAVREHAAIRTPPIVNRRWVAGSIAIAVLLLFGTAIAWATQWSYYHYQGNFQRVNRWTGQVQAWKCERILGRAADVSSAPKLEDFKDIPVDYHSPSTGSVIGDLEQIREAERRVQWDAYWASLDAWRSSHPNIDPATRRYIETRCGWQSATTP